MKETYFLVYKSLYKNGEYDLTSIHKELDECEIEQFEKDNLFKLLKFMDPDEAFRIIGIIKEKKYVNYDYLNKAKKNNVEYLAQSIELKPIVTEHEVMTFLRNVNINSDNASSLISSKIRYDEEEEVHEPEEEEKKLEDIKDKKPDEKKEKPEDKEKILKEEKTIKQESKESEEKEIIISEAKELQSQKKKK